MQENAPATKTTASLSASHLKVPTQGEPATSNTTPSSILSPVAETVSGDSPTTPIVGQEITSCARRLPYSLHHRIIPIRTQNGKPFVRVVTTGNPYAFPIESKKAKAIIAECARGSGVKATKKVVADALEIIDSQTDLHGEICDVWLRVAPIENGIEIDAGDEQHTRVRITAGKVEIVESGSSVVFVRTANMLPITMPATKGDRKLLKKYINVHPADLMLVVGWITYTLAHPKVSTSKYPILVLLAVEGSGKSLLCRLLMRVIDPSSLGVQAFPKNSTDLAIASRHSHLLCFDNLRTFRAHMADMLCIAATGGTIASRQLYTNAEQEAITLHSPIVLNGIHHFIEWPDLAQRCLPIHLPAIPPEKRKSESDINAGFETDLPMIMRGLFDLVAEILTYLPKVEITSPERMIDFVAWLAAMEKAEGVPLGVFQSHYSDILRQGQLDTLMDNPLAAAIIELMDGYKREVWTGTPTDLLGVLNQQSSFNLRYSHDWPQNSIALSKRLAALQAGLLSQGIRVELSRGKNRKVILVKEGESA